MENEWDYMPAGRQKTNHGVGAVCKFTLNITDSPYTGLLKDGIQTGLIRISQPASFTGVNTYAPSASIKFLRSGVSSANFVAIPNMIVQMNLEGNNIFDTNYLLHNHVLNSSYLLDYLTISPDHDIDLAQTKLSFGDRCPNLVGLSDISRYIITRLVR